MPRHGRCQVSVFLFLSPAVVTSLSRSTKSTFILPLFLCLFPFGNISGRQLQASKTFSLDHKVPIISSLTHTSFSFSCLCLLAQFSNLAAAAGDNFWVRNVKWAVVVVANRLLFWKPCWWIYCLENVWTLAKKSGKSTCLFVCLDNCCYKKGYQSQIALAGFSQWICRSRRRRL